MIRSLYKGDIIMKKNFLISFILLVSFIFLTACENFNISTTSGTIDLEHSTNSTSSTIQNDSNTENEVKTTLSDESKYTEIKISSVKDLYQNIKPYTRLILTEDYYNISYIDTSNFKSEYVDDVDAFDGYEFVIHDIDHLEICSADNILSEIVTEGPHVNVISLKDCKNVKIDGLVLGHEVEKGECSGGVIQLDNCDNIEINNCHLYGCGTYGIISHNTKNVTANNCDIYECSYGILDLNQAKNFTFNHCIFRDNGEYTMFSIYTSSDINFNNCTIAYNYCGEASSLFSGTESSNIIFTKCLFQGNEYQYFSSTEDDIQLNGCYIKDYNQNNLYYIDYEE